MINRKWSAEEDAILKRLWPHYVKGEIKADAITRVIGRSDCATKNRAGQLGLTREAVDCIDRDYLSRLEKELGIS